jgi:hypothetical protein
MRRTPKVQTEPKPAKAFKPKASQPPTIIVAANEGHEPSPANLVVLPFHGDEIVTFQADDGPRVAMRRIVENMGLDWSSQHKKLVDQGQKFTCGDITTRDSLGRLQSMTTMPVAKLALWLATINPNKVRADLRDKVELYQAESAVALHDYWTKGVAMRGDLDGIVTGLDPKVASQIGGIIKGIVHNQLSVILPQLIQAEVTSHQYVGVRGLTAGEVLDMAGFTNRKGLRGLAGWASSQLRRFHAAKGTASPLATLGRSTAYVFDRALSREWLDVGGRQAIEMKIAERRGQTVMKLVRT